MYSSLEIEDSIFKSGAYSSVAVKQELHLLLTSFRLVRNRISAMAIENNDDSPRLHACRGRL
jgi:hypothetical protein